MKNLRKLLDINSTQQEIDNHMNQLLEQKFDAELKSKYENILADKYQIQKQSESSKKGKNYFVLLAGLLALAFAAFVGIKQLQSSSNPQQMAANYHETHPFAFELKTRSTEGDVLTLQAYAAYQAKSYDAAISALEGAASPTSEQKFLLGYIHFVNGSYRLADEVFKEIKSENGNNTYVSEAKFYRVMSLLAAGNKEEALNLKASFDKTSWEWKELSGLNIK